MSILAPITFWGESKFPPKGLSPGASMTSGEQRSLDIDEENADDVPLLLEWSIVQAWEELSLMLFTFGALSSNSMLASSTAPSDSFLLLSWCVHNVYCFSVFPELPPEHWEHFSEEDEFYESLRGMVPKFETLEDFLIPEDSDICLWLIIAKS